LLGTADEDWWPLDCFAVRARKQVCSFVFYCHRTAQKMQHVAFRKNAAVKQPSVRSLPLKTERFIPASAAAKKNPARAR
jgi:hypothetical protein